MKTNEHVDPLPAAGKKIVHETGSNPGPLEVLKAGVESLSGVSMTDVHVHYNSPKPAQMDARSYAETSIPANEIHAAPGQEKHLPHEAWHVVEQEQVHVKPMQQATDVAVNDDAGLEHEADVMGARALPSGASRD
jgi:hypothetical protein